MSGTLSEVTYVCAAFLILLEFGCVKACFFCFSFSPGHDVSMEVKVSLGVLTFSVYLLYDIARKTVRRVSAFVRGL